MRIDSPHSLARRKKKDATEEEEKDSLPFSALFSPFFHFCSARNLFYFHFFKRMRGEREKERERERERNEDHSLR